VPPLPAAAAVLRCSLQFTVGTDANVFTRFHVQYSGGAPTNAEAATFAAAIATAFGSDLKSLMSDSLELTTVYVEDLTSDTAATGEDAPATDGTRSGTALPAATCLVAAYNVGRRYRGGHPRGYWPFGVAADLQTEQTWTAAFTTACGTGFGSFFTAIDAAGWSGAGTLTHVNVSYYSGFTAVTNPITGRTRDVPKYRVGGPVIDDIVTVTPRTELGSQRRRNIVAS
jgi:hypothetical protein